MTSSSSRSRPHALGRALEQRRHILDERPSARVGPYPMRRRSPSAPRWAWRCDSQLLLGGAGARDYQCVAASFDEILREHGPALWRVVASYAPAGPERDDLAQDVLLAVWQALSDFAAGAPSRRSCCESRTTAVSRRRGHARREGQRRTSMSWTSGRRPTSWPPRVSRASACSGTCARFLSASARCSP